MTRLGEFHRFVPGATSAAPTLLVLHGTGGDENDLLPLAREVSPSASLLAPRGPVLENGMPRFFRRLEEGVFDLEDLALRTRELAAFVRTAADRYGFAPSRLYALGYSNGANIAASLLLTDASALAGAVLFRAMLPFEPEVIPELGGKPIFLAAGRSDPVIPEASVRRLAEVLQRAQARVEMAWSPSGHGLEQREVVAAREWFARQAGGG